MLQVEELRLSNPGVLISKVPLDVFDILKEDVAKQTSFSHPLKKRLQSFNSGLVGSIEEEYKIDLPASFANFLSEFYDAYRAYFDTYSAHKIKLIQAWANLQKKTEYNPNHMHTGHLSWVTWLSIPYSLENEDKEKNSKFSKEKSNSRFTFVFSQLHGAISTRTLDVDKSWEGKIMMFPSKLMHGVYPFFTSDELRISVAGNLGLSDKE